ncbi:MAG: hypothetical protein HKN12_00410, partial [Gemmatimonadetes bacterium]|nr:hypothetical protein [Gemmatimonadota bacterium]
MSLPLSDLAALFPDPVVTRGADPDSLRGDLFLEERAVVAAAREKRR